MKLALALCLCGWLATSPVQATISIPGQLQTSDLLATDTFGSFYYDAYALTVTQTATVQVSLGSPDFDSWLALWAAPVLPAAIWDNGLSIDLYQDALEIRSAPASQSTGFSFVAQSGMNYQLAVATNFYDPTPMGAYTLTVSALTPDSGLLVSSVPEPAALPLTLAGLGMVLLATRGRRRTASTPDVPEPAARTFAS